MKTKWRYKTREIAHYWIDYIKANIKITEKSIINWLSVNSNFLNFDYNSFQCYIEKMPMNNINYYGFFCVKIENVNLAFIWIWGKKNWNIITSDFIEMTWQWLNIFWVDFFYFLFEFLNLEFKSYKRVDFALDLFLNINYFYKRILKEEKKEKISNIFQSKKNWIETIYFWKKEIIVNTYWLSRIYNKILDSVKKEKLYLYNSRIDDKWKYKDVCRFEFEARSDLCKYYNFDYLKNEEFIFNRIRKSFYSLNNQFFKFIDFDMILKYSQKEKEEKKQIILNIKNWDLNERPMTINQEKILNKLIEQNNFLLHWKTILDKEKLNITIKTFVSYAKKLKNNWFNEEKMIELLKNNVFY